MADVNEPFHAIRDVARQITGGKSTTTVGGTKGGQMTHLVEGKLETPMETADRMSGSQPPATNENASESGMESSTSGRYSDHSSTVASNAGRQSQSTDHMNQY